VPRERKKLTSAVARVPWTTGMVPEEALIPTQPVEAPERGRKGKRAESTDTVRYASLPPPPKQAKARSVSRAASQRAAIRPAPRPAPEPEPLPEIPAAPPRPPPPPRPPRMRLKAKAKGKAKAKARIAPVPLTAAQASLAVGAILPTEEEAERRQVFLNMLDAHKLKVDAALLGVGVGKNPNDEPVKAPPVFSRKVPSKGPPVKKKIVIRKVSIASGAGGPLTRRAGRPAGSLGKAKRDAMAPGSLLAELGF
jgi:hypothetical protein